MTLDDSIKDFEKVENYEYLFIGQKQARELAEWLKDYKRILAIQFRTMVCPADIHDFDDAAEWGYEQLYDEVHKNVD